ncbi:hypothetical protein BU16DRAFT_345786 [Lophium mytilinum]|uniref:DUF125-domain-containing protein n=1 Tax=Lophium mytilinum TaxID=390894 RepID=A0A6A6QZE8_9PEZI|nr:hypothetical protein BU16DRAFT_345786 [Lophium mytilinum]
MLVALKRLLFPSRTPLDHPYSALPADLSQSYFALDILPDSCPPNDSLSLKVEPHSLDHRRHSLSILGWLSDARVVSDATIGLSDGLTVPFALSAGLSTLGSSKIVIFAGLAELIAGAISMGLGAWLAASGEVKAYNSTLRSTQLFVQRSPSTAMKLAHATLQPYLLHASSPTNIAIDVNFLALFLMRFHHNLPEPADTRGAWLSAVTMGGCYFFGGFVPLVPCK